MRHSIGMPQNPDSRFDFPPSPLIFQPLFKRVINLKEKWKNVLRSNHKCLTPYGIMETVNAIANRESPTAPPLLRLPSPMFFAHIQTLLAQNTSPVILLEGTRQLPAEKRQALVNMGRRLAEAFPQAVFRSGNATGTDEAFAAGVATVPGAKLELVLPTPGMGRSRRPATATCHTLDDLPLKERHHLARESIAASTENHRLFELYLRNQSGNPAYAKAQYLVRDALKV